MIPIMLNVKSRLVVCVGGGPIAARKLRPFIDRGAHTVAVAKNFCEEFPEETQQFPNEYVFGSLVAFSRPVCVIAATGVEEVDDFVAREAELMGALCLRVDEPGDVALPATIRMEGLTVSVATGVPALTKKLKEQLETQLDDRWGVAAATLSRLRREPDVQEKLRKFDEAERRRRWHDAADVMLDGGSEADAVSTLTT